ESILHGACELVECHMCAIIAKEKPALPSIDPKSASDPVLADLLECYARNNIQVWLKDFTLGMPVPTVGALAVDPATFPEKSEIVFTAGTATSPAKAAIRALTEVAQLAGDFETGANFEASGLPKYTALEDFEWLKKGKPASLDSLPDIRRQNFLEEIGLLCKGLSEKGLSLYSVDITHPELGLSAHYNFVPGFEFRERARNQSLGLFVGRILAEESPAPQAEIGLGIISEIYKNAPFVPFFQGLLALREQEISEAAKLFEKSEALQTDDDDRALAAFYQAYALTQEEDWAGAVPPLDRAVRLSPQVKEYFNLRGVALFKAQKYEQAAQDFKAAVDLDSGSAMDLANLGLCYKFMGEEAKAVHCLGTALTLDPTLEFAQKHLENILKP
ncbi:MAG: YcaO-like family protein, partial [Thermodesulfobacteriota bacterium]|nr:YcaO-like family protein [Thermodesulfobacteriota bacterium]